MASWYSECSTTTYVLVDSLRLQSEQKTHMIVLTNVSYNAIALKIDTLYGDCDIATFVHVTKENTQN